MLQRLKDTFLFKNECLKWQKNSGFLELMAGNRIAELHGLSPSYGQSIDVVSLRQIYSVHHERLLESAQTQGLSSRHAVLNLVCEIASIYMREKSLTKPPKELLYSIDGLAPCHSAMRALLEKRWLQFLENFNAENIAVQDEQSAFMPILRAARQEANLSLHEKLKSLDERETSANLHLMWRYIPNRTQETERVICKKVSLPLTECVGWLMALERRGVVTCIGTSLSEPKFWKTPPTTLRDRPKELREFLDSVSTS